MPLLSDFVQLEELSRIRKTVLFLAACTIALAMPALASAQGKASTLDTAKAKASVGDWVLTVEGRRGPQERPLAITDLVLKWTQEGQQGSIPVVMTLTLKDGALVVKQEMAGGQFTQAGTGKKKG